LRSLLQQVEHLLALNLLEKIKIGISLYRLHAKIELCRQNVHANRKKKGSNRKKLNYLDTNYIENFIFLQKYKPVIVFNDLFSEIKMQINSLVTYNLSLFTYRLLYLTE